MQDDDMHVALSIGGSSVNPAGKPDLEFVKAVAGIIKKSKNQFGILTGGGSIARIYAQAARDLGAGEYEADSIAITATRQNAQLLIAGLKGTGINVYPSAIYDFDKAKEIAAEYKVVVMGGTIPGITTDTDAVLLGEAIGAKRLVNVSNVDAIYDKDPRKNKNAKKYAKMDYEELVSLALDSDKRKAGTHFVFDMLACKLIARSSIETHFVSGKNIKDMENAIEGKKHNGTLVK